MKKTDKNNRIYKNFQIEKPSLIMQCLSNIRVIGIILVFIMGLSFTVLYLIL